MMAIIRLLASQVPAPDIAPDPGDDADRGWASTVGPLDPGSRFSEILQFTREELAGAADDRRLLQLQMNLGIAVYPELQRVGRLIVLGLNDVLQALYTRSNDPWAWTRWLDAAGARDSPIAFLRSGRIDEVRLARTAII